MRINATKNVLEKIVKIVNELELIVHDVQRTNLRNY